MGVQNGFMTGESLFHGCGNLCFVDCQFDFLFQSLLVHMLASFASNGYFFLG